MGAFAVNAAVEGKTGYMVGFKRILNNSYKCDTTLIPLEKVAGIEKRLPDHFINNQGNYINQGFIEYCKPLVGKLPDYAKLEEIKIKKSV
jgi:6-phosphofructokinase 1